jgi:NADPH2:quinone reductase
MPMMRAVQAMEFGPPDVLVPSELPEPTAGPGQMMVGVKFARMASNRSR